MKFHQTLGKEKPPAILMQEASQIRSRKKQCCLDGSSAG